MFQKLLKRIAGKLSKFRIPYMVIGGQAVLLYGEPRLTKDIDITLGLGVEEFGKVMDLVVSLKLKILVDAVEDFVKKTMVFPVMDEESGIRVDFILSFSPYERQAIERANPVKFGGTIVNFASLEDVIIHKVIAGRARDLEDVRVILLKNPKYDHAYIGRWLKKFDSALNGHFFDSFRKIVEEIK